MSDIDAKLILCELSRIRGRLDAFDTSIGMIQRDYTIDDLVVMTGCDRSEISRKSAGIVGHYKMGRKHRFRRSEVDYRRSVGHNLITGM